FRSPEPAESRGGYRHLPDGCRLHGSSGAEAGGPHSEPLGTFSRGPLRTAAATGRWLKLFLKEDLMPAAVFRPLFILAPIIALSCALISIGVIPFGENIRWHGVDMFQIADVNIGLLVILGVTSIGVYGIALSGWSSNNKYSLLGSLRSSAQMVSYELALGLSVIG